MFIVCPNQWFRTVHFQFPEKRQQDYWGEHCLDLSWIDYICQKTKQNKKQFKGYAYGFIMHQNKELHFLKNILLRQNKLNLKSFPFCVIFNFFSSCQKTVKLFSVSVFKRDFCKVSSTVLWKCLQRCHGKAFIFLSKIPQPISLFHFTMLGMTAVCSQTHMRYIIMGTIVPSSDQIQNYSFL